MKTDDRDERLGSILDRAVRDIDVSAREAPVGQVRVVGRAGRMMAAVAAAAVFVGAVAFASAQFGRDTPPGADSPETVIEGTLETDKWQLERPPDWFTSPFDGCGTQLARGLIVSNVEFDFRNPEGEVPSCNERMVFAGFPSDGVAIDLEPQGAGFRGFLSGVDSPLPLGPSQLLETESIKGGPRMSYDDVVIDGVSTAIVRLWIGPQAAEEDVATAHRILGSISIEGADRWVMESPPTGGAPAVTVSRPEDWHAKSDYGVWFDTDEQPVLRISSPGLPEDDRARGCGEFFIEGDRALPAGEVVVTVGMWTGGGWVDQPHPAFQVRPARFSWSDAKVRRQDCGGEEMTVAEFWFSDAGSRWVARASMDRSVFLGFTGGIVLEMLDSLQLPIDPDASVTFLPSPRWITDSSGGVTGDAISAWTANADMTAGEATFPDPAALAGDGILVTVFQVGDEPPAPDNPNFPPASLPLDLPEEIETSWEGYTEGRSRSSLWIAVNGRALEIKVYYGTTDPSEEMLVDAEAALERLIVDPVPAPPTLPPPVRDDYRSEFVSDERGYRFWPRSAPVEPGVAYRFQVPHCGLGWLVDFDGSFWEGTPTVDGSGWVPAEDIPDGDVGTIELTGADWAEYRSSDGTWTLLSRVDGPIVRQPCE